jgi:hypothetical protein
MAIPDTTTEAAVFLIDEPDFSREIEFTMQFVTDISSSHSDVEQRAKRRLSPKYQIAFTIGPLDSDGWPMRKSRMIRELGAPVVVPIWIRPVGFTSEASDVVTVDTNISKREFRVGSYALFREAGLSTVFRKITAIGATTITCETGNAAFPDITVPSYTSAAEVFPCILGLRNDNEGESVNRNPRKTRENVRVNQL